jgi:hypothetical protein
LHKQNLIVSYLLRSFIVDLFTVSVLLTNRHDLSTPQNSHADEMKTQRLNNSWSTSISPFRDFDRRLVAITFRRCGIYFFTRKRFLRRLMRRIINVAPRFTRNWVGKHVEDKRVARPETMR